MYNRFRFPELDIPVLDKALNINITNSFVFCYNKEIMLNKLKEDINYQDKVNEVINNIMSIMDNYFNMDFFLYYRLFEKIEVEINSSSLRYSLIFNRQDPRLLNQLIYYFSYINSG